MKQQKISAGMNGAGRFGLHLLQYWIENYENSFFSIDFINDDYLTLEKLEEILKTDRYLRLRSMVTVNDIGLIVKLSSGQHQILFTHSELSNIPWLGKPDIFFECSGKHTTKSEWNEVIVEKTKEVILSATSWTADEILVYGFNHDKKSHQSKVLSYGSCTVNAYIPLAMYLNNAFSVVDSDVTVIHNVPVHQIDGFDTLKRKTCTLELVAPHLLDFLHDGNFKVNYTLVPYTGVSMIDFRFRLGKDVNEHELIVALEREIKKGSLYGLYDISENDEGPERHKFTRSSAVLVKSSMRIVGDSLYIHAYFDNENSVNRYFDLVNYLVKEH